ncbi:MAG TPA: hypothetical protein VFX73_12720, partial [Chitinophagaceae bacterium]|nr:hypothetical protein [Chitinophagaceae bacterium]
MVPSIREEFNKAFTKEKYEAFLEDLHSHYPGTIDFRIAETPEFIPKWFSDQIIDSCEHIIDIILDPGFKNATAKAIPPGENVANENSHPHFIAFDFGVCENAKGELSPQLIEMQGFPTLFGFQAYYPEVVRKHFDIPSNYSHYFNGLNKESYTRLLRELIVGDTPVENVILLEITPHHQKTRVDFYCTQDLIGIEPVCISDIYAEGKDLYYD